MMSWLIFALATIFFYSIFDLLVKISSSKINGGLGAFIMNIVSALVVLIYMAYSMWQGEKVLTSKPGGVMFSTLAGIAIGLASIFFIRMFATGTNLSIGVPLVRIGIVLLASLLGIFILKESITFKYAIGFIMSLVGLYLIFSSK